MADGKVTIEISADDSDAKKKLNDVNDAAEGAAGGIDGLADSTNNAEKGLGVMDIAAGNLVANGISALISGIGDAIQSIVGLAEETREYREDMAKLDTAFSDTGHSSETASKAYEDFYAILGESDRSVEAVNHLAELTKSEEEVAKWSIIAAGVTAKFGDSLPIEGLTEAANETAKVGQVTGPLADALNWAGISEDKFNEKLADCTTEQERATLITNTLNGAYSEAAAEYNELTASTQDARRSTSEMEAAQAALGAAIEPVITAWTSLKADALEAILPIVQAVIDKLQGIQTWMEENPEKAEVIKGVILGVATAIGVLVVAFGAMSIIKSVTSAFKALNAAMNANPILFIISIIAALVSAFIYLWNNCEGFRNFWIGLWDGIKSVVSTVVNWFVTIWQNSIASVKLVVGALVEFFSGIWDGIKSVFSAVADFFGGQFSEAWNAITTVWNAVVGFFSGIWDGIKLVFDTIGDWFQEKFSDAKENAQNAWNTAKDFFSDVWAGIQEVFSNVGGWFQDKFNDAKENAQNAWNDTQTFFSGIWEGIKTVFSGVANTFNGWFQDAWNNITSIFSNIKDWFQENVFDKIVGVFSTIKDAFKNVGSNIINGIWEGIKAGWDWLVEKVKNLASALFSAAQEALDSHSPSRKFAWLGETMPQGIGVGWDKEIKRVKKQLSGDISSMTGDIRATVTAENSRMGQNAGTMDTGLYDLTRAVGTQTAGINSLASQYRSGVQNIRPVILMVDGRELGRTVVDVGKAEETRVGLQLTGA